MKELLQEIADLKEAYADLQRRYKEEREWSQKLRGIINQEGAESCGNM